MSYIKLLVSSFSFIKFQYEVDRQAYFRLWGKSNNKYMNIWINRKILQLKIELLG